MEQEIAWAEPAERPQLWMDLAELRMTRLGDPDGALRAYQEALTLEPGHKAARGAVEKLLNLPDTRELAAEILEPVLRLEPPSLGLLRVLEVRAELAQDTEQKLQLLTRSQPAFGVRAGRSGARAGAGRHRPRHRAARAA